MNSLGSHLKEKREEADYSIDEVADATNIAPRYIRAIEEHDFSQFPADVYAKGFIRSYANFLDLDAQSLIMEYSLNFESGEDSSTESETRDKLLYWVAITVLLILGLGLVFLRFAWLDPDSVNQSNPVLRQSSARTTALESSDKTVSVSETPEKLRLKVVATAKTWVYAVFDGLRKKEFMFQPGDEMTWTAEDTVRIRLGNAGGIRLYHRGKPLPKLGRSGEVADKIITLNSDNVQIRTPGGSLGS